MLSGLIAVEDGMAVRLLREFGADPVVLRDQLQPRQHLWPRGAEAAAATLTLRTCSDHG